ncbi:MAG: acetyl-CoA sensor PanZ family protein [Saccharospirillum sp.]|uniref:acetyl-CoA sensor PanZ family protein n=1 Tax=Saccharospirillum sp. TaxID=2033801 RepID=UPI0034A00398
MPVTLDFLAQSPAAEQPESDTADLARLAQDMLACPCYRAAWEDWLAGSCGVGLYAARFNGRIVGAVLVKDDCLLSLGVRALTRGRGIGYRMLSMLAAQRSLRVSARMHPELASFVNACLVSMAGPK